MSLPSPSSASIPMKKPWEAAEEEEEEEAVVSGEEGEGEK